MSQGGLWSAIRRSQIPLTLVVGVLLLVTGVGLESASAYTRSRLAVSTSADRASSVRLDGAAVEGQIYVFVRSPRFLTRVDFYLDDPGRTRPPVRVDTTAPFDFAGTAANRRARPYDTVKLTEGSHTITAVLRSGRSASVRSATFRVTNQGGSTPSPTASATSAAPTPATTTTAPSTTPTTATPTTVTPTPSSTTATPSPTAPTTSTSSPTPTSSTSVPTGTWPSAPPARICGNTALLSGPASPPAGAIVVPAGNNSSVDLEQAGKTYWFAPGVHTLGTGEFSQIIPGDGSTFVGGPGAIIDGQSKNKYAFTQHARGVTIKYLTIRNFVAPMNEGTVNHDSGEDWTMQYNTVVGNGGAGIFVGAGNVASYNCLKDNSQYGFQAYGSKGGESDIVLDHNEIVGNNTGDWESKVEGCGCTGGGKFWDVRNVRVTNNYVHDNRSVALWADTNDNNFLFEGNWIENNHGQAIFWEISYNVAIRNNVIRHNLTTTGPERIRSGDNFPDAAIYISESGGDARLPHDLVGSATIDIANNLIEDNYNGVALWENADRFCGSAANTSSGYCTQVNPSVAKLSTCTASNITKQPYYSDCRWKTQNVKVHHNTFKMDQDAFAGCKPAICGRNAIFSNWGSYPDWSPYQGEVISKAITYDQGNVFSNNTYVGTWSFTVLDTGKLISAAAWRAAPYRQDAGSTFTG